MNRRLFCLIVFFLCVSPIANYAQDSDSFWVCLAKYQESQNHREIVKLLKANQELFNSSNVDKFIFYALLSISQYTIKDIDDAWQSISMGDKLLSKITSRELEYMLNDLNTNMIYALYTLRKGEMSLRTGRLQTAEESFQNCYQTLFMRDDHEKLEIYRTLHLALGSLYLRLNNLSAALKFLNGARIGSVANALIDENYCKTLLLLGGCHLKFEDYLKAKMCFDEASSTLEDFQNKHLSMTYFQLQSLLCSCYIEMGHKEEAMQVLMENIARCKTMPDNEQSLSNLYSALGYLHFANSDFVSAKAVCKEAYNLSKRDKSKTMRDLFMESTNLALSQFLTNDMKYISTVSNISSAIIEDVIQQLSFLSSDERARYWETNNDYLSLFNSMLFLGDNVRYFDDIYNNVLFAKGLLLRTTNTISEKLKQTNDYTLHEDAANLQRLKHRELYEELSPQDLSSLQDSIKRIEKRLTTKLVGYQSADSLRNYYSFQSVKKAIDSKEAVIEFIKMPELVPNADSLREYYAAIVFQRNSAHPNIVRLCSENQLTKLQTIPNEIARSQLPENTQNELYRQYLYGRGEYTKKRLGKKSLKLICQGDSLYNLIWKPLERYINGAETIYYATSGLLNGISFNALSSDSLCLAERYTMCYLSSTSEVLSVKSNRNNRPSEASIYGGINYDTTIEEMQTMSRGYDVSSTRGILGMTEGDKERGSWGFLSGSEEEATDISKQLTQANISNKLFVSSQANEESFKANSGHSPNLFHVATHGFFYSDARDRSCLEFLQGMKGIGYLNNAQAALSRAGILFSGANRVWRGEIIDENIEDGILTAEEVSHLDLSNTDMVVLSACETGLGRDVLSEGVYGLQRGFKLAGVQTLIMSLWKVPDTETSQLMQSFYRYWLGGMDKRSAFQTAQKEVKEKNPNPYYWAGFVMLD